MNGFTILELDHGAEPINTKIHDDVLHLFYRQKVDNSVLFSYEKIYHRMVKHYQTLPNLDNEIIKETMIFHLNALHFHMKIYFRLYYKYFYF